MQKPTLLQSYEIFSPSTLSLERDPFPNDASRKSTDLFLNHPGATTATSINESNVLKRRTLVSSKSKSAVGSGFNAPQTIASLL